MGLRYVSINGTVEIIEDQETIRNDILRLTERYIKDEEARKQYRSTFMQQDRLAFRLTCEKVTEFFA
jgi:hypothetical protein